MLFLTKQQSLILRVLQHALLLSLTLTSFVVVVNGENDDDGYFFATTPGGPLYYRKTNRPNLDIYPNNDDGGIVDFMLWEITNHMKIGGTDTGINKGMYTIRNIQIDVRLNSYYDPSIYGFPSSSYTNFRDVIGFEKQDYVGVLLCGKQDCQRNVIQSFSSTDNDNKIYDTVEEEIADIGLDYFNGEELVGNYNLLINPGFGNAHLSEWTVTFELEEK